MDWRGFSIYPKLMTRKKVRGLFALLFVLSIALFFLWRRSTTPDAGSDGISLSYNICLQPQPGTVILDQDNPLKLEYLQNFWIDSTRQYYSKAVLMNEGDTLHVSAFNALPFPDGLELLLENSGRVIQQERGKTTSFSYARIFSRRHDVFLARYLMLDLSFNHLILVDHLSTDSLSIGQSFDQNLFLKRIRPCL